MGYLVTIDGLSGSGKSTAIRGVTAALVARGLQVHSFHDRYGEPTAAEVDKVQHGLALSPLARLYLMLAVRRQVIDAAIIPSLAIDDVTITDRYYTSTIAYQAYGQGLDKTFVKRLSIEAAKGALPEQVFYLDVPVPVALERMNHRGEANHVFDSEIAAFHERVRNGYLAQCYRNPRATVIDGTKSPERIAEEITTAILHGMASRL